MHFSGRARTATTSNICYCNILTSLKERSSSDHGLYRSAYMLYGACATGDGRAPWCAVHAVLHTAQHSCSVRSPHLNAINGIQATNVEEAIRHGMLLHIS